VCLSHLNKDYLLAYLLTYLTLAISLQNLELRAEARVQKAVNMWLGSAEAVTGVRGDFDEATDRHSAATSVS